jgi:hypothetical protein
MTETLWPPAALFNSGASFESCAADPTTIKRSSPNNNLLFIDEASNYKGIFAGSLACGLPTRASLLNALDLTRPGDSHITRCAKLAFTSCSLRQSGAIALEKLADSADASNVTESDLPLCQTRLTDEYSGKTRRGSP